jgi:hypothetical protein
MSDVNDHLSGSGRETMMARRNSSLGFLGRFGRSEDLRRLDQALHEADLHPRLVADGAKLAIVNLMKDHLGDEPAPAAYPHVAALLAYCVTGAGDARDAERVDAAVEAGSGLDAEIILLTLVSKLASPAVIERHGLSAETGE